MRLTVRVASSHTTELRSEIQQQWDKKKKRLKNNQIYWEASFGQRQGVGEPLPLNVLCRTNYTGSMTPAPVTEPTYHCWQQYHDNTVEKKGWKVVVCVGGTRNLCYSMSGSSKLCILFQFFLRVCSHGPIFTRILCQNMHENHVYYVSHCVQ